MKHIDDLLSFIFDGQFSKLYFEFEAWLKGSRSFRAFAEEYQNKIRAKLKNATEPGRVQDLRAELLVSSILLSSNKLAIEYETYASNKQRGPDFTVTFKTHTRFNVEVRRLSSLPESSDPRAAKLAAVLCEKCRQLPPSLPNILWLASDELGAEDLTEAIARLRKHADLKDEAFFSKLGFESSAGFLKTYARLSAVVLSNNPLKLWLNPQAKHKLATDLVNTLRRLGNID